MTHTHDEEPQRTSTDSLMPTKVSGFEECGAMWTFYSERELALETAIHNQVHELEVYEAYLLDNERRHDMGYPSITFEQFLECVNHTMHCVPDGKDCKE